MQITAVSFLMVELTGFEPVTSSLPAMRASNCAKTPYFFSCYLY